MTRNWREHFLKVFKAVCRKKLNLPEEDDYGLKTKTAKALNVNPNLVSGWYKKSFPRPENLIQINNVFGISPNELLGIEKEKPKEFVARIEIIEQEREMIQRTEGSQFIEKFVPVPIATGKISGGSPCVVREDPDGVALIYERWARNREDFTAVRKILHDFRRLKQLV